MTDGSLLHILNDFIFSTRVSGSNYSISVFSIFFHYSTVGYFLSKKPNFRFFRFLAILANFHEKSAIFPWQTLLWRLILIDITSNQRFQFVLGLGIDHDAIIMWLISIFRQNGLVISCPFEQTTFIYNHLRFHRKSKKLKILNLKNILSNWNAYMYVKGIRTVNKTYMCRKTLSNYSLLHKEV